MMTASMKGLAQLWDAVTGAVVRQFETPAPRPLTPMNRSHRPVSMAVSHKGDFIVTAFASEHIARMWDVATGVGVRQFQGPRFAVQSVAISPDDRYVLVGGSESHNSVARGVIIVYDVASGREDRRFALGDSGIRQAILSPDGRQVLTLATGVQLWDSQTGEELQAFPAPPALATVFSPNMQYVVTGDGSGGLGTPAARLWDLCTAAEVRRFEGHELHVWSLAMSPNGQHLLTGHGNGNVRLWDVATGSRLWEASCGNSVIVGSAAFSPDGRYALTGSGDSTARLWYVGND